MRAYVVAEGAAEIEKRISEKGSKAVAEILSRPWRSERGTEVTPPSAKAEDHRPDCGTADGWRRCKFTFDLTFGDYGATAYVDFRMAEFGDRTLVLVFMYTSYRDQEPDIARIVKSVAWQGRVREETK